MGIRIAGGPDDAGRRGLRGLPFCFNRSRRPRPCEMSGDRHFGVSPFLSVVLSHAGSVGELCRLISEAEFSELDPSADGVKAVAGADTVTLTRPLDRADL